MQAPMLTFQDAAAIALAGLRQTVPVRCGTFVTPQTSTQPLQARHCAPVQTKFMGVLSSLGTHTQCA